jgi:putative ABC transport system substrate-binding protein
MKKKITVLTLCAMLLALCGSADAQQPTKIPRIGYVSPSGDPYIPGTHVEAFRQGLREIGYIEGKNILVEYRYQEGKPDRRDSLVAELVQLKVDVLVLGSLPAIRTARQATQDHPYCYGDNSGSSRDWARR